MPFHDSYLFPTLETGCSRVFNICACTAQLDRSLKGSDDPTPPAYLFRSRELNHVILVKEARPSPKTSLYVVANPVGTKLYFPYDDGDIYGGGKSAFFDDPQIRRILTHHGGLDFDTRPEDAERDLKAVTLLDELPSLDPFLVKDRLSIEGIDAHEIYFQISEAEWKAIQTYVMDKLKSMIAFAFRDSDKPDDRKTFFLLNKLWNTEDMDALMPVADAFHLPREEASKIFAAWKGIMYYDFEYSRSLPKLRKSLQWLQEDAGPTDYADPDRLALLRDMAEAIRERYGEFGDSLREIFTAYEDAYEKLFVHRQDPGPFLDFMRDAMPTYWTLGSRMSAINHSVLIWDMLTSGKFKRRLRYEELLNLFELQHKVLNSCN